MLNLHLQQSVLLLFMKLFSLGLYVALSANLLGMAACKTSKGGESHTPLARKYNPCGDPIVWQKADAPATGTSGFPLPAVFETYTTDANQLKNLLMAAPTASPQAIINIPLPAPLFCQSFELKNAGTMSPELAEKYPEIVSLKGSGINNVAAAIRLDFDGQKMRGQITWDEKTFLIYPLQTQEGMRYIIYEQAATGEQKQPFERRQPPAFQTIKPTK
jgi:hypothetical protein